MRVKSLTTIIRHPFIILALLLSSHASAGTALAIDCTIPEYMMYQNLTNTGRTTLVMLQNLSTHDVEFVDSAELNNHLHKLEVNKPFVFVANGIPKFLPASVFEAKSSKPKSASPLAPMVIAYQDWASTRIIENFKMKYKIKDVCRDNKCADIDFYLYLRREPPPKPEKGNLGMMFKILGVELGMLEIAIEPFNPIAWVSMFVHIADITNDEAFAEKNRHQSDWKVRIGAWATQKEDCYPGGSLGKPCSDSIALQAPEICGAQSTRIVVTILGIRGEWGKDKENHLPSTMITIHDFERFYASALSVVLEDAADKGVVYNTPSISSLQSMLSYKGIEGVANVSDIIGSFDDSKRRSLASAVYKISEGDTLYQNELNVLGEISERLSSM